MKKRVHELAKELKVHGIELDNKDLVSELQSLGYDVKSHSSSLEDDQALSAVEKIVAKRKPKAPPPPVKAAGFVVRRRPTDHGAPSAAPAMDEPVAQYEAPPAPEMTAAEVAPPAPEVGETAPAGVEMAAAPGQPAAAPAVMRHVGTSPHAPSQNVQVEKRLMTPAQQAQAAQAQAVRPTANSNQVLTADANKRPTATQAVVLSRPLIPVKRVTPSSTAHKNIPVAPGPRAIGPIKDLKVVRGEMGRPNDFVDQTKDKAGVGVGKRRKTGAAENLSKQEIMDIARGRTTLPLRGKKKKPTKKGNKTLITEMGADKKFIPIEETITVSELSQKMGVRASDLIKKLMTLNIMATVNQMLDVTTAELLASEHGWKVEKIGFEEKEFIDETEDKAEDMRPRPPVVTVMGHVDHGKTSLLDAIRQAKVADGEAGGITQHIGAYSVLTTKGPITFLDTPGHEAFSAMRGRGAKVTDLVVLVVAAEDGVMPQTVEAIAHAREAKVPIIVAINKMDKPGADAQKAKNALMEQQLVPEEYGGDTIMVPVSAKTRMGLDQLLEMIALQAEVLELKANPTRKALGAVVEAKLDKGRGPVATVLVQDGTLKLGDAVVSGMVSGKIRAMMNERGDNVEEVAPGYPVEILGLSGVPVAGDDFNVVDDETVAKHIADHRVDQERKKLNLVTSKSKLEDLFTRMEKGVAKELKLIVKADTQGSVEAVAHALNKLATAKVKVVIVSKGVGGVTESDVDRAIASKAIIIGFNSKPEATAAAVAAQHGVQIKLYDIIYTAVDEVKVFMEDLLEPIRREKLLGKAEVRQLFNLPKQGAIAGCAVVDGKITRASFLRLVRGGKVNFQGKVKSLKRLKEDVREVASPLECGVGVEGFTDFQPGDLLEAFEIEEIRQSLN